MLFSLCCWRKRGGWKRKTAQVDVMRYIAYRTESKEKRYLQMALAPDTRVCKTGGRTVIRGGQDEGI
jgi:hypothetical protein